MNQSRSQVVVEKEKLINMTLERLVWNVTKKLCITFINKTRNLILILIKKSWNVLFVKSKHANIQTMTLKWKKLSMYSSHLNMGLGPAFDLWQICVPRFSRCLYGFTPGVRVYSHSPKTFCDWRQQRSLPLQHVDPLCFSNGMNNFIEFFFIWSELSTNTNLKSIETFLYFSDSLAVKEISWQLRCWTNNQTFAGLGPTSARLL